MVNWLELFKLKLSISMFLYQELRMNLVLLQDVHWLKAQLQIPQLVNTDDVLRDLW